MKNKVAIEELQADMERVRAQVLRATGLSENDLNDMIFDSAGEWLTLITRNDSRALEFIPHMREFWAFWRRTWYQIDCNFLHIVGHMHMTKGTEGLYRHMHRVSSDNINLNNVGVQAHYHILRAMITTERNF